jgi:hypothetical protein
MTSADGQLQQVSTVFGVALDMPQYIRALPSLTNPKHSLTNIVAKATALNLFTAGHSTPKINK